EALRLVVDRTHHAAGEGPVRADARLGQHAEIAAVVFVVAPALAEVAATLDLRRPVRTGGENGRRHLLVAPARDAPERQDLDVLARPPARHEAGAHVARVGAVVILLARQRQAGGDAQAAFDQRQARVQLQRRRAVGVERAEHAEHALVAGFLQPVIDDAGRRRERIVQ
ncbi:hypothetical protein CATMIT_01727, partial [Catenibacterium mitsuokai DSM 15897]